MQQPTAPTLDDPRDYDPFCRATFQNGDSTTGRLSQLLGDDADGFAEAAAELLAGARSVSVGGGAAPLVTITLEGEPT